ncbi:hypothetical protein ElyMa_003121500 [Elysia marginata]|uniref:Uncharacterized protein n=1 Tax=Elysia marginata TaxID=1093978 RepID=A0AAV4IQM4_9GAST|nr:hypothetical protein ElyMa_003121500 [Elysia marginata]
MSSTVIKRLPSNHQWTCPKCSNQRIPTPRTPLSQPSLTQPPTQPILTPSGASPQPPTPTLPPNLPTPILNLQLPPKLKRKTFFSE